MRENMSLVGVANDCNICFRRRPDRGVLWVLVMEYDCKSGCKCISCERGLARVERVGCVEDEW